MRDERETHSTDYTPKTIICSDVPRSLSLMHHNLFTGYQWHTLCEKMLRAGIDPDTCTFVPVTRINEYQHTPALFIAMGEYSLRALTGKRGIDKWHLSPLDTLPEFVGRKCIPTFDMDRTQKQFELGLYQELAFRRALAESKTAVFTRTPERFQLNPSTEETLAVLDFLTAQPKLSVDVETGYGMINTVGFAWSESDAIAIRTLPGDFDAHTHMRLWKAIQRVLEGPALKIFQNFIFDTSYFSAYGIRTANVYHDTMWAQKFLYPELEMNLGNVGRLFTNRPYWKDDGKVTNEEGKKKDWGNIRDWTRHLTYNCLATGMKVVTEEGLIPIDKLVKERRRIRVRSYNEKTHSMEWKFITNWLRKKEPRPINWVKIKTANDGNKKGLLVTPDHRILTQRGWIEAETLRVNDIMCNEALRHCAGTMLGTILGDSCVQNATSPHTAYLSTAQIMEELVHLKQLLFGGTVAKTYKKTDFGENTFYELYVPACAQIKRLRNVPLDITLKRLTPMGIALWIMDDGCKQKGRYPNMKLALQSYSQNERIQILNYFKNRYQETASLDKAGNISFAQNMSKKICAELGYYFVPSLRYKMSHPGPEFSLEKCLAFKSKVTTISNPIVEVSRAAKKKKKGYRTSYCISVEGNENFLTEYGIVKNCRDTTGAFEAHVAQRVDLQSRGLLDPFDNYVMRLAEPILEMCSNGVPLDLETRDRLKIQTQTQIESLTKKLHEETGRELNPRSPKQVMTWLKEQNVTLPKKFDKAKGNYRESADASSLKKVRLKHPDISALGTLADIRSLDKALGSYIDFAVAPNDNRLRYSLNGTGTETLRFAGNKDPWDRGFNIQTIPREGGDVSIKSMFVAPQAMSFVEVDLRQAESRFVAYDAADTTLIDMLESGADVHRYVAAEIFKVNQVDVTKDQRQLGKKAGHGANYAMKGNVFRETCFTEMDLVLTKEEAEKTLEAYHRLFPGIRRWHKRIKDELFSTRKLTAPSGWERYFYGRYGDDMFKEAFAWRPQHTIPWITNHLMFYLRDERAKGAFQSLNVLVQVHDALYLLVNDDEVESVARVCLDHMKWHPRVELSGGTMYIPTEVKQGKIMSELKEVHL